VSILIYKNVHAVFSINMDLKVLKGHFQMEQNKKLLVDLVLSVKIKKILYSILYQSLVIESKIIL